MADGGRGSYEEEEVPMTAEEESAFASAQAATGMAMLHKPHSAFRVMATELGGNMGSDPSSQRGMADPSAHDSAARSKERRQRCGECHGCTRDDCGVCVSCQVSTPPRRTRERGAAGAHARCG